MPTDSYVYKYGQNHDRHVPEISYKQYNLSKRMLSSIVSNAEDRSSSVNRDRRPLSRAKRTSFAVFGSNISLVNVQLYLLLLFVLILSFLFCF